MGSKGYCLQSSLAESRDVSSARPTNSFIARSDAGDQKTSRDCVVRRPAKKSSAKKACKKRTGVSKPAIASSPGMRRSYSICARCRRPDAEAAQKAVSPEVRTSSKAASSPRASLQRKPRPSSAPVSRGSHVHARWQNVDRSKAGLAASSLSWPFQPQASERGGVEQATADRAIAELLK